MMVEPLDLDISHHYKCLFDTDDEMEVNSSAEESCVQFLFSTPVDMHYGEICLDVIDAERLRDQLTLFLESLNDE